MMQWILIMTLLTGRGVAVSNVVMYDPETCDIAAAKFVEVNSGAAFGSVAKAFCVPRSVDKHGAVTLDK